jgi:hypothetical protein
MKKYAFINLPSQELERPPAAAALLSSIIRSIGWDCRVFDFNIFLNDNVDKKVWADLENYWRCKSTELDHSSRKELENALEKFKKIIDQYDPDWIGVSVFSRFSTISCIEFLKFMRSRTKATLMIGGHGISSWPGSLPNVSNNKDYKTIADYLVKENYIDHYITGDGEDSLKELLLGNTKFPGIDGLPPIQVKNLDSLPKPSYNEIEPMQYYYTDEPGVYMTMSKGCVRRCTFCSVPDMWPKFMIRSPELLVDEIKKNKMDYGVNLTHFTDSLINGSMKHFRELNERLIDLKKDQTFGPTKYMGQFICRTRQEQNEKDWEKMGKAGANLLVTGFESYSEKVRKHMGKNYSNEDIAFHFEQSAYWGIKNVALMFVGYPVETEEDHDYNKQFLYQYQKYAKAGSIHLVRWGYTGMFRDAHKVEKPGNVEMIIDPDWEKRFKNLPEGLREIGLGFGWVNKKNPSLTLKERIRRRLELHDLSVKLGWPQTRSKEELTILYNIMKNLNSNKIEMQDIQDLEDVLDFH